jgi:hypothetical protein
MSDQEAPKSILAIAFERGQEFERGRWKVLARAVVRGEAELAARVDEEPDKERRKEVRTRLEILRTVRKMIPDAEQYEEADDG